MKGEEINLIDVRGRCPYTDVLLLVSGTSDRHVNALAERLAKVASDVGLERLGKEGGEQGNWVLLDLGDIIVHLFYRPARMYYDIESLWADAPQLPFQAPSPAA